MTLLVASIENGQLWIVADSAITGGILTLREREYGVKVDTVGSHEIIGYAGDVGIGTAGIESAAKETAGRNTIQHLAELTKSSPGVEFAYGYCEYGELHLLKISDGRWQELPALHLGDHAAFELFQNIRHRPLTDYAPDAVHSLSAALTGTYAVPRALAAALSAMFTLFSEREGHDVGGWPIAYVLTNTDAAQFCSYISAVSDPILNTLNSGDALPHGTAEAGGSTVSLTELPCRKGHVVYWLQSGVGRVYLRQAPGVFAEHRFKGPPDQFSQDVKSTLGESVELWTAYLPLGPVEAITYFVDNHGLIQIAVLQSGTTTLKCLIQSSPEQFEIDSTLTMEEKFLNSWQPVSGATLNISPDKSSIQLNLDSGVRDFTAQELDKMIEELGEARKRLNPKLPLTLAPNSQIKAVSDPAWQVVPRPHREAPGPALLVRHTGYGWIGFHFPPDEARSIADWLLEGGKEEAAESGDST